MSQSSSSQDQRESTLSVSNTSPLRQHSSVASQKALVEAYFNAIRSGQIGMPGVSQSAAVAATQKAQQQANHNRTISDVKRGVTFAGQDQLKHLPIPSLEETCEHYLESAKPFLVRSSTFGLCRMRGNLPTLKR
jgi:hypothetical protein